MSAWRALTYSDSACTLRGTMKTLSLALIFIAIPANFGQTGLRATVQDGGELARQSSSDNDIGIVQYPRVSDFPEATQRLLEGKSPTWLLARAYRTDDEIKAVIKYFKTQAQKAKKPAEANALLKSLLRDNWKIREGLVGFTSPVFGVGSELSNADSSEETETSFGVIVLEDSLVRVHLMSPHPSLNDNNKLASGTMIVLIRERLPSETASATNASEAENEKVYSGREVTRKARVKSKPKPPGRPGIYGTVVLRAVFTSDGKVTNIRVMSGLPGGLTEAAIEAAKKIKFEPAVKDGRYVSTHVQLEYHFLPAS